MRDDLSERNSFPLLAQFGMSKHSPASRYQIRRYSNGSRSLFVLSGAEVAALCVALPVAIQAMRKEGGAVSAEYSRAFALLLDLTLSAWWGVMPERDAMACKTELPDFVQAAALAVAAHVDRFAPSRSSWRTVARFVRMDARKQFTRKAPKCCPPPEVLETAIRGEWDGVYRAFGRHGVKTARKSTSMS